MQSCCLERLLTKRHKGTQAFSFALVKCAGFTNTLQNHPGKIVAAAHVQLHLACVVAIHSNGGYMKVTLYTISLVTMCIYSAW